MAEEGATNEQGQTENTPDSGGQVSEGTPASRPDSIPEKFWNAEAGAIRAEDIGKAYTELETRFRNKQEEIRAEIKADLEKEITPQEKPEAPESYEFKAPEGVEPEAITDTPQYKWFAEFAKERGFSQDEFQAGINSYLEGLAASLPDQDAEFAKLGENAKSRAGAVAAFLDKHLPDPADRAIADALTSTANGVRVVETLMRQTGMDPARMADNYGGYANDDASDAEIRKLQESEEYWHPSRQNPAVVKKVNDYYAKKFAS